MYLFIISAPSGAGKSTVINKILNDCSINIKRLISYTTRKPRGNEQNGIDYNFVSKEEFKNLIDKNLLLEWAIVHNEYYGTARQQVETAFKNNVCLIKDIDVQGALKLKKALGNRAVLIFLSPPSMSELEKRLRKRHTDSEETIQLRLKNAQSEMAYIDKYEYTIVNDTLEQATQKLKRIIQDFCNG